MLKILAIHQAMPHISSYTSRLFENILPLLKSKGGVHITWLVHKPEKLSLQSSTSSDTTILDIHDFNNALEVMQKVKPDITYVLPGLSIPDYTFALTSRYCKTPLIGGQLDIEMWTYSNKIETIKIWLHQIFQSSSPTDINENEKKFMKRSRFFVYKHLFFLRTLKAIKKTRTEILIEFFTLFKMYFRKIRIQNEDPKFSCDLNFLDNENMVKKLVRLGFKKSSLLVTGNPTYDAAFQKSKDSKPILKKEKKIHVLFLSAYLAGAGGNWNKRKQDSMIKKMVTEISKYKNEISLIVKIHPFNEVISDYQPIINSIDPSIPVYKEGDIMNFLEKTDVVITTATNTAGICSLILKKPIIVWNFFNVKNDLLLDRGLVSECKVLSQLVPLIHKAMLPNQIPPDKVEQFCNEFLYKTDGHSSQRISNAIIELITKSNKK